MSRAPRVKSQGTPWLGLPLLLQLQLFAPTKHRSSELCPLSPDLCLWSPLLLSVGDPCLSSWTQQRDYALTGAPPHPLCPPLGGPNPILWAYPCSSVRSVRAQRAGGSFWVAVIVPWAIYFLFPLTFSVFEI